MKKYFRFISAFGICVLSSRAVLAQSPQSNLSAELLKEAELTLNLNPNCFVLSLDRQTQESLACDMPVKLTYSHRSCENLTVLEIGDVEAKVTCPDTDSFELKFKTSRGALTAVLGVRREANGRTGTVVNFVAKQAKFEPSQEPLAEPILRPVDGALPDNAPFRTHFTGFAWVEFERSQNFGYDGNSAVTNFKSGPGSQQAHSNFFSNLELGVFKDRSSLTTVLEVGEVLFGEDTSGGGQGARQKVVEVRNMYLSQSLTDWLRLKAGVMPILADPKGFVLSDHYGAFQLDYNTDLLAGAIWYASAAQNKPGANDGSTSNPRSKTPDEYVGLSGSANLFSGVKYSAFGVLRKTRETIVNEVDLTTETTGNLSSYWAGAVVEYRGFEPLRTEATVIGNWRTLDVDSGQGESLVSHLLNAKLGYFWTGPQIDLSFEALATPGSRDSYNTSGKAVRGRRKHFSSPSPGAAYLLSLATSDGADDSPGVPKESILANLNTPEGLEILTLKASKSFTKRFTGFLRFGRIQSAVERASTQSSDYGTEWDLGAVYQISPGTLLQIDAAQFAPGKFFAERDAASFLATKMKFSF